jgi:hypothetical protein
VHTGLPIRRASLLPEEDVTPGRSGAFELGEIEAPDNPRMVATSVVPLPFALEEGSSIRAPPERTTASCGSIPDALNAHAYRHVRDGRPPASCSAFHCSSSSIEMTCSLSVISRRRMRLERIEMHTLSRIVSRSLISGARGSTMRLQRGGERVHGAHRVLSKLTRTP